MLSVGSLKSNTRVRKTTIADKGNNMSARWWAGFINIRNKRRKLRIRKVKSSAMIKLDLIE